MNRIRKIAVVVVAMAVSFAAHADPITFSFTATTTSIDDSTNVLQNSLEVGDVIFGEYTFDDLAMDGDSRTTVGSYRVDSAIVVIGNQSINASAASEVSIFNDIPDFDGADRYHVVIRDFLNSTNAFDFTLFDSTGIALSSDGLPLSPPNLLDFQDQRGAIWRFYDSNQQNVLASANFIITSITTVSVPEPGTLALLGIASSRNGVIQT